MNGASASSGLRVVLGERGPRPRGARGPRARRGPRPRAGRASSAWAKPSRVGRREVGEPRALARRARARSTRYARRGAATTLLGSKPNAADRLDAAGRLQRPVRRRRRRASRRRTRAPSSVPKKQNAPGAGDELRMRVDDAPAEAGARAREDDLKLGAIGACPRVIVLYCSSHAPRWLSGGRGDATVPENFIFDWNEVNRKGRLVAAELHVLRRDPARRPAEPVRRGPAHRRQARASCT